MLFFLSSAKGSSINYVADFRGGGGYKKYYGNLRKGGGGGSFNQIYVAFIKTTFLNCLLNYLLIDKL